METVWWNDLCDVRVTQIVHKRRWCYEAVGSGQEVQPSRAQLLCLQGRHAGSAACMHGARVLQAGNFIKGSPAPISSTPTILKDLPPAPTPPWHFCEDTPGWKQPGALTCARYEQLKYCTKGVGVVQKWAAGKKHNYPERNCCACKVRMQGALHACMAHKCCRRIGSERHNERLSKGKPSKGQHNSTFGTRHDGSTNSAWADAQYWLCRHQNDCCRGNRHAKHAAHQDSAPAADMHGEK